MGFFHFGCKNFSLLLLIPFGLAVLLPFFHHHGEEDGQNHETCPLCVHLAHPSELLIQEEKTSLKPNRSYYDLEEKTFPYLSTLACSSHIRAPPRGSPPFME